MKMQVIRYSLVAATLAAVAGFTSPPPSEAQNVTTAAGVKAKTTRPKSRTEKATITAVTANSMQVTTKEGALDVALTGQTEYWRQEEDLTPAELKVGDTVAFALRGTDGQPTVTSLSPLTLKFGDTATLTFAKTDKMSFSRLTKAQSSDLATGQNISSAMNVLADGKLEARKVTVVIAKPKAPRAPRAG